MTFRSNKDVDDALMKVVSENASKCTHGVKFDPVEAQLMLEAHPAEDSAAGFVMGSPAASVIRKKWPRLMGKCPLGCGYVGIAYASYEHYIMGDW